MQTTDGMFTPGSPNSQQPISASQGYPGAPPGGYGPPPGGGVPPSGGLPGGMGGPPGGMPPGGPMGGPPMGGPPGGPMMGAPPAAPPKKGGAGLIIGIGAVVAVAAAGGAAWYFLKGGGGSAFPCDVANLPEETAGVTMVSVDAMIAKSGGFETGDVPDQARWSDYAQTFCAGRDVFSAAMGADDKYGAKSLAKIIEERKDAQKYLECGKTVAGKAKGGTAWAVSFKEKKDRRRVTVFMNGLDELPESVKALKSTKDKGALVQTHCFLHAGYGDKEAKDECDDKSEGIARVDKTNMWVQGGIDDLTAFGNAYSDKGANKGKEKEALAEVAGKISAKEQLQVGSHETFPADIGYSLGAAAGSDALESEDKDELGKVTEKIKKAEPFWAMGGDTDDKGGKIQLYIRGASESDAKDLAELTEKWLKLNQKAVKATEDKEKDKKDESDFEKDMKKVKREYLKTRKAVARRAMKEGTSEQKGNFVVVTFEYKPESDETTALQEYKKENKGRVDSAAKIVDALLKGEKPEKDLLKELGGSDLVDAVDNAGSDKKKDD